MEDLQAIRGFNSEPMAMDSSKPFNNNGSTMSPGSDINGNRELEELANEIRELESLKHTLEQDVNKKESSLKLKESEMKTLQNEDDVFIQMIKQLESQKLEARKMLDNMSNQCLKIENDQSSMRRSIEELVLQVDNLRHQVDNQKDKIEVQENELTSKRQELDQIKSEERKLQTTLNDTKKSVEALSNALAGSQLQISQYKTKIMHFENYERQLIDVTEDIAKCIADGDLYKLNSFTSMPITPPQTDMTSDGQEPKSDFDSGTFREKDGEPFSMNADFASDPFAGEDPFPDVDFSKDPSNALYDPFFAPSNGSGSKAVRAPKFDFEPFSNSSMNFAKAFENDPFTSISNNNSGRTESPTPELPPKKGKAPPPRPAPPKQGLKPARPAPPAFSSNTSSKTVDPWANQGADPFAPSGQSSNANFDAFGSSNFADFADFDKIEIKPIDPYAAFGSFPTKSDKRDNRPKTKASEELAMAFSSESFWS